LGDQTPDTTAGERVLRFALASLAVWRLTHLLAAEDGPAGVIAKLRRQAGGGLLGELMDCFDCLSLWVAAGFVPFVARRPADRAVAWLALSGVACALQRITGSDNEQELDLMVERGGGHGMLRE